MHGASSPPAACGAGRAEPTRRDSAGPRQRLPPAPSGRRRTLPVETTRHAFAYVFEGGGTFRDASSPQPVKTEGVGPAQADAIVDDVGNRSLVLFDRGDEVVVQAGEQGMRFLLISGRPLEEPVAWYGPIVMNTQQELRQAAFELQNGTFIKG